MMAKVNDDRSMSTRDRVKTYGLVLAIMLATMWGIEIIDNIFPHALDQYGIRPRHTVGLIGLVTAPFLHWNFAHLAANSIPFVVLGFFVMLRGLGKFIKVTAVTAIVGGLAVWLVGASNSDHIGASGVIFGYFGFLLGAGIFERSFKAIAAAVIVGLLYGGIIFGIFPSDPHVSWEGHLFGFVSGGGYAYLTVGRRVAKQKSQAGAA